MGKKQVRYDSLPKACRDAWESFLREFPAEGSMNYEFGIYLYSKCDMIFGHWKPKTGPEVFIPVARKIRKTGKPGRPAWELRVAVNDKDTLSETLMAASGFVRVTGFPSPSDKKTGE